jgi:adenylate cyclase
MRYARRSASIPNDIDSLRNYATVLGNAGLHREALAAWDKAVGLDPFFPPIALALKARNNNMLGEFSAALPLARTCAERAPRLLPCFIHLAVAANEKGAMDEARSAVRRVLEIDPRFMSGRFMQLIPYRDADEVTRYVEYLRRAGLPG